MMYHPIVLSVPLFLFLSNRLVAQGDPIRLPPDYQTEFTDADFDNYTIDVSKEVGVIPGTHGVSATGGATYTIPIQVPPGTNGVQPQLAVTYNSQGGDGIMGMGWQLSGLSAITRAGRDWFHDGFTKPVTLTPADKFALDGQLLVPLYGSQFDTEAASFSKIMDHGVFGTGPEYFTVVTKDGTYMEYGNTVIDYNNSRVAVASSPAEAIEWRLNRVTDPHGNYIRYEYEEDESESILTKIEYTGNLSAGITPYVSIEFSYMLRDDVNEQFIAGYGRKRTHLLKQIKIVCEGNHFKRYVFNYTKRDIAKSYLQEVREYGSDDVSQLNPTRIMYGNDPTDLTFENTGVTSSSYISSADYDGDGDAELLVTEFTEDEEGNRFNTSMKVYRRDGSGNYINSYEIPLGSNYLIQNEITDMDVPRYGKYGSSADINGDGRDDIVVLNPLLSG